MLSHRPTPLAVPSLLPRPRRAARLALGVGVGALVYALLREHVGPASALLAIAPAVAAGWLSGARLGLVLGCAAGWLDAFVSVMSAEPEAPTWLAHVLSVVVAGSVGWAVGRLHDTRVELTRQLEQRNSLARELTRARAELETKVDERTRALARANEALKAEMAERREAEEARAMLTEQRFLLEQQLLRAQKMEAIGRLAGGVAHDFNNLLTAILGFADLASHHTGVEQQNAIAQIGTAAERASELTRALLAFARQQPVSQELVDVNALVSGTERLLERLIGEDISLTLSLSAEPWHVMVEPARLEQVIVNLAVNARDAMPAGGTLSISTETVHTLDGDVVRISVRDTGVGMDEATRARLFEPFFTTKEPGQGTGLGLATSYGIVAQAGGQIHVHSEPGAGTIFEVELPRAVGDARPQVKSKISSTIFRGRERVLLVEDEPLVRAIMEITLSDQGYEVVCADTPARALETARALRKLDAVVCDVVLPGQNGPELVRGLRELLPNLAVLYVSGYSPEEIRTRGVAAVDGAFLEKPFAPTVLVQKLRDVLERHKARGAAAARSA